MPSQSIRGEFLWHELMTSDPAAAIAFYSKIIGWKEQTWESDPSYTLFTSHGVPTGGCMKIPRDAKAMGAGPLWTPFIGSPDVEVTAWEAQRLGGKLHKGPEKTPSVGTWAILQDPQGASFAAYTPEAPPKIPEDCPVGDFSWHELAAADHRAAFDFYRGLFGWTKQSTTDMGPAGEYLIFGTGKRQLGGMYTKSKDDATGAPAWLSYIRVTSVKATAKAIPAAGATITLPPMEVPGGDWITVARDPQGAAFATHERKAAKARPAERKKTPRRKVTRRTAKVANRSKTRANKKPRKKGRR